MTEPRQCGNASHTFHAGLDGHARQIDSRYFGVSKEIVWKTLTQDLPGLPGPLAKMLKAVGK